MRKGAAFLLLIIIVWGSMKLQIRDMLPPFSLLLFSSIAFAVPARAGFFNLGVLAQMITGALAAVIVMQRMRQNPVAAVILVLLSAALAGAVIGAIPLILRKWGRVSEVISSILLNGLMVTAAGYILRFRVERSYEASVKMYEFSQFDQITLLVAALLLMIGYTLFRRSFLWVLASAQGESPSILQYGGFRPNRYMWLWVIGAAMLASCGGALRVIDEQGVFTNGEFALIAFSGIVGAMLLGDRPAALISSCVLLAILDALRPALQAEYSVPREMLVTFEACLLLVLLLRRQMQEANAQ
jgi:ABC-type uncharacterized transport system permease subunit